MKIYTKLVLDMSNWDVLEEESFEYNGPVAQCVSFDMGGGASKGKPVKLPNWNLQQQVLWKKDLYPSLKDTLSKPPPSYPRQMYVPRTDEEESYFGRTSDLARQIAELKARSQAALAEQKARGEQVSSELARPAFEITPETTEQYYQQAIRDPAMRQWEQFTQPGINEEFVGAGYWGTARAQEQMRARENLSTELGRARADLYYKDEQDRRQALTDALNRQLEFEQTYGGQLAEANARNADTWAQAAIEEEKMANMTAKEKAEYSRQIEQEKVAADFQRWLMGEEVDGESAGYNNPYYQLLFQALGLTPFSYGQETESAEAQASMGILA